MQEKITTVGLALLAVIIISLALSSFPTGAKLVQGLLIIAIVAVVLRNEPRVQAGIDAIRTTVLKTPA